MHVHACACMCGHAYRETSATKAHSSTSPHACIRAQAWESEVEATDGSGARAPMQQIDSLFSWWEDRLWGSGFFGVPTHMHACVQCSFGVPTHMHACVQCFFGVPTHMHACVQCSFGVPTHMHACVQCFFAQTLPLPATDAGDTHMHVRAPLHMHVRVQVSSCSGHLRCREERVRVRVAMGSQWWR